MNYFKTLMFGHRFTWFDMIGLLILIQLEANVSAALAFIVVWAVVSVWLETWARKGRKTRGLKAKEW